MTFPVEDKEEKKTSLFDMLSMIETVKTPWNELTEDQQKAWNIFMINRFISSKDVYAPVIAQIDTLKLTPEQHYTLLCEVVANNHKHYFDYKAYKKEKPSKNEELLIYACSKEYEIGKREAKMYLEQMNDEIKSKLMKKWEDHFKQYGEK